MDHLDLDAPHPPLPTSKRNWAPNFDLSTKGNKKFDPARVGRPGYPKTQEAYDKYREDCRARAIRLRAEGKFGRGVGRNWVPDGWGRRKAELAAVRERAAAEARHIMTIFKERGIVTENDDPRAVEALGTAVEIMRDVAASAKDRLAAGRTLLEWLKAKPSIKTEVTVSKPEDWLREVLDDGKGD